MVTCLDDGEYRLSHSLAAHLHQVSLTGFTSDVLTYPSMPQDIPYLQSEPAARDLMANIIPDPGFGHSSDHVLDTTQPDKVSGFQSCLQCPRCLSEPRECGQASCIIPEMTSECTDQCLVVACDDPDHPSSQCQVINGDNACDGSCTSITDCLECPGFEEIVSPYSHVIIP